MTLCMDSNVHILNLSQPLVFNVLNNYFSWKLKLFDLLELKLLESTCSLSFEHTNEILDDFFHEVLSVQFCTNTHKKKQTNLHCTIPLTYDNCLTGEWERRMDPLKLWDLHYQCSHSQCQRSQYALRTASKESLVLLLHSFYIMHLYMHSYAYNLAKHS